MEGSLYRNFTCIKDTLFYPIFALKSGLNLIHKARNLGCFTLSWQAAWRSKIGVYIVHGGMPEFSSTLIHPKGGLFHLITIIMQQRQCLSMSAFMNSTTLHLLITINNMPRSMGIGHWNISHISKCVLLVFQCYSQGVDFPQYFWKGGVHCYTQS